MESSEVKVSGDAKFVMLWAEICRNQELEKAEWVDMLRSNGIKAAHPNDGWINRERDYLTFQYPQFNDGADIGDLVMLGWPSTKEDKLLLVRLTKKHKSLFSVDSFDFERI